MSSAARRRSCFADAASITYHKILESPHLTLPSPPPGAEREGPGAFSAGRVRWGGTVAWRRSNCGPRSVEGRTPFMQPGPAFFALEPRDRLSRLQHHHRDFPGGLGLIAVIGWKESGHHMEQALAFRAGGDAGKAAIFLVGNLEPDLGLVAQIEEPGRMIGRAALRGDDHEAVPVMAVDEGRRPRRLALAAGRLQQKAIDLRRAGSAEIDHMPFRAVAPEVKLDMALLPAGRAGIDFRRHGPLHR